MTLLMTAVAASVVTVIWYVSARARVLKTGLLCYMFWGASLMWMVDAVAEYREMGADFFKPAAEEMMNDAFLGISVITLALTIWIIIVLAKDPLGVIAGRKQK